MRALALAALCACHTAAPARPTISSEAPATTEAPPPPTEACVRGFVQRDLGAIGETQLWPVPAHGTPSYLVFVTTWGEAHDCEAGCFRSSARGVALSCDRIGWFEMNDYESGHRTHAAFRITAGDTSLFDDRLWPDVPAYLDLAAWIARSPGTPADVKAKAQAFAHRAR